MATSTPTLVPDARIALRAPATPSVDPRPGFGAAVLVRLDDGVLDDFKRAVEARERLQFVAGNTPKLRIGSRTIDLTLNPDAFRNELYASTTGTSASDFTVRTLLSHRASIASPAAGASTDDTRSTERALSNLQDQLASYAQQKEANSARITDDVLFAPRNRYEAARRERLDRQERRRRGILATGTSQTSNIVTGSSASQQTQLTAVGSKGNDEDRLKAMRIPLVHFLALGPATFDAINFKTHIPRSDLTTMLPKVAREVKGEWSLVDRWYKELNVWNFKYQSDGDREAAIGAAIRAYDRLRLSKDDKLWQLLLPEKERGQGKVLSRLMLNNGGAVDARHGNTPLHNTTPNLHGGNGSGPSKPITAGVNHATGPAVPAASPGTPAATTPRPGSSQVAMKKRIFSKNPQKARAAEDAKLEKRREKEAAAEQREKAKEKDKPVNRQPTKKANSKFKSAEFISTSDEEDEEEGEVRENKSAPPVKRSSPGDAGAAPGNSSSDSSDAPLQSLRAGAQKPKAQARVGAAGAVAKPVVSASASPFSKPKLETRKVIVKTQVKKPAAPSGSGAGTIARTATTAQPLHKRTPSAQSPVKNPSARVAEDSKHTASANGLKQRVSSPKGLGISGINSTSARAVSGGSGPKKVITNGVRKRQNVEPNKSDSTRADDSEKKDRQVLTGHAPSKPTPNGSAAGLKRKAVSPSLTSSSPFERQNAQEDGPVSKYRRVESSTKPLTPLQSTGDSLRHRKANSVSTSNATSNSTPTPAHWPSGADSSGSFASLNFKQGVAQADDFRHKYYPAYAKLYDQLEERQKRGETPHENEYADLWTMHHRLEQMKHEIVLAAQRESKAG